MKSFFASRSKYFLGVIPLVFMLASCTQTNEEVSGYLLSKNRQEKALSSTSVEGISLVEKVDASHDPEKPEKIVIPYTKYQLKNGLTVILHPDQSDPLVHVDVTYHVGSAREEAKRSGFAHFFEHMMFQGSENVGDDEHFKIVTEAGGRMNGTTNNDRTNYFETVPSNNLETMLWLESDRMGFLLDAVTQEKFEIQRATVKNERGQNYDNRPYGLFNEINNAALYPADHPYAWPVIGYIDDLNAATLDDLKKFFLRWYGPNNATLTIGGNFDEVETLKLIQKYFGEIPAGPAVDKDYREPVVLDSDRYVSYVDKNIRFPALLFTFPTVPSGHPDELALQCLADIVGQGRKSFLYKQFVLSKKAIEASAFNNTMELAGSMTFFVLPFPGTSLSQFEKEMRGFLDSFDESSITDEDIQIFKASRESGLIQSLASVQGKVSRLAYYETFYSEPNTIQKEIADIQKLTKADVLRVFNQYIKNKHSVVQSVVPESNPEGQAKADNFKLPERPDRQASSTASLPPRPVVSSFDRSQKPKAGPVPLVSVPDFWKDKIYVEENGHPLTDEPIEIIGSSTAEIPLINIQMNFSGGHLAEPKHLYGLASITSQLMNEGTKNFSAEAFEIELQKLGSNISVSSSVDGLSISVVSLVKYLDATLDLLEERLYLSDFQQSDLDRIRQQQIEGLEANKKQPNAIATDVYRKLLYGEDHPLSVSNNGEKETLENIELEDVREFSTLQLSAKGLQIVVVGDIEQSRIMSKLKFLKNLPLNGFHEKTLPETPKLDETVLYFVDKPGAAQSEIRIGYMSDLTYNPTGEYFKRYLMNYVLGGAFSSRINLNLREDKGYTYGARSGFSASKRPGPFTASASVKKDSTADSVVQFMAEIATYRQHGITEEELSFTQSAIGQSDALSYETPRQKAGFLADIIEYNLPNDFVDTQLSIINSMTKNDIDQLAKKYLPIEKMFILVVGDKKEVRESIGRLGYPVIELTTDAKPIQ
ncbi:MAG: M16 family metallopeptidase [Cellvibrionaceae bacterium]